MNQSKNYIRHNRISLPFTEFIQLYDKRILPTNPKTRFSYYHDIKVNWHLTKKCNYNCRFCYDKHLRSNELSLEEGKALILKLFKFGFHKINFAGGEPLLNNHILEYCRYAKSFGMEVSIVTNGSLLTDNLLCKMKGIVDSIGLSIDSPSENTEKILGRGDGDHVSHSIQIAKKIRA